MGNSDHTDEIARTIEHLTARWARADKSILRAVFPLLATGVPVTLERISQATGADASAVELALQSGRTDRNARGEVTELFGITISPTTHRIEVNGVVLYSCCALVAQMVPELVDKPAHIESLDPISRQLVRVDVTPAQLVGSYPTGAWGTFVRTEPEAVQENVGEAFCHHIHLFTSRAAAEQFIQQDDRRYILDMVTFHDVARQLTRAVWKG